MQQGLHTHKVRTGDGVPTDSHTCSSTGRLVPLYLSCNK